MVDTPCANVVKIGVPDTVVVMGAAVDTLDTNVDTPAAEVAGITMVLTGMAAVETFGASDDIPGTGVAAVAAVLT